VIDMRAASHPNMVKARENYHATANQIIAPTNVVDGLEYLLSRGRADENSVLMLLLPESEPHCYGISFPLLAIASPRAPDSARLRQSEDAGETQF